MKNILLSIMSIIMLITTDVSSASTYNAVTSPIINKQQTLEDGKTQLAQRGLWGRRNYNRNFQRQQQQRRLQQQRLQQQRLQRQRMEQRRRQQAQQRKRQQEALRARQRQAIQQRQRIVQQRRIAQTRQRQEAQRRQQQQRQTAQKQAVQTQRIARQQLQNQQRLRRLKQLRERNRRIQVQKQQQKQRDLAMLASLRAARSVSILKSPAFKQRVQVTRTNLQKVKTQQAKLNKKNTNALNKNTQKVAKLANLKSKVICNGSGCSSGIKSATEEGSTRLNYDRTTKTWTSPAGLNYGQGSKHGNRVKHVLQHAKPNLRKPKHTVFSVPRKQILKTIDDAWKSKSGPPTIQPNGNRVWDVPMKKAIGTNGEKIIRIVVKKDNNSIVTAFPYSK